MTENSAFVYSFSRAGKSPGWRSVVGQHSGPSTGRVRPADRPTGIVAAKYDVTIQIPAYHAPPRRTAINHSNPGTPGSYFKQYLAEAPCFPAKSRPPPPRDSIDWCIRWLPFVLLFFLNNPIYSKLPISKISCELHLKVGSWIRGKKR